MLGLTLTLLHTPCLTRNFICGIIIAQKKFMSILFGKIFRKFMYGYNRSETENIKKE